MATRLLVTGAAGTLGRHALAGEGPLDPAPWARAVLDGYRAARNAPAAARTLGTVTFAEWLARRA